MGGRGAGASWGGGGGGSGAPIETTSLISQRERKEAEVDSVLSTLRDVSDQYGVTMNDVEVGVFPPGSSVMGYYDPSTGALGVNGAFFDTQKVNDAYDNCIAQQYHPARGSKSGMEALASHEAGHRLTYVAGEKNSMSGEAIADRVVEEAAKELGYKNSARMAKQISGYALTNKKEAIAEAFADVYCNGNNARKESRAIVKKLNSYLR
ncbi:MAG: hypothetical protein KBS75_09300 [Bacteroidales bacterium]|nr:hypothetical protein [Candidatus Equimonas faecalis]